jgi:3-oxoacyl-[acyl-carrier protein] reductase
LNDKVEAGFPDLVIVTGAGRGIGRSIALDLGRMGATVLCISQSHRAADTSRYICGKGGRSDCLLTDLGEYEDAREKVNAWLEGKTFSRIGVVLAAAILGPPGPLKDAPLREWERTLRTNVLGNLAVAQATLPAMLQNRYGRLLFFAGGGAAYEYPIFPAYAASKTALVRAVENLHEDIRDAGNFAVTILAPGAVETDTLACVREHGGFVRTTVPIDEPVEFARQFLSATTCEFSGCFVHVRDRWQTLLNSHNHLDRKDLWKLRRVE